MPPDPAPPAPPTKPPRERGGGGAMILVVAVVSGLAGGFLGAQWAARPLQAELATRPPVIVLDLASALDGLEPEEATRIITRYRDVARKLADGGVLVLDKQAVLAAPEGAMLPGGLIP